MARKTPTQIVTSTTYVGMGDRWDSDRPNDATYKTWRSMRENPTVAIARVAANASITSSNPSYVSDLEETDPVYMLVRDTVDRLWKRLIRGCLTSCDLGWQPFEIVWSTEGGVWNVANVVQLKQEKTKVKLDEQSNIVGLQYDERYDMGPNESFVFTYDQQYDSPFGRSRHENIRKNAWEPWCKVMAKMLNYVEKSAGVTVMLEYPIGRSKDASGGERDNSELARDALNNFGSGKGVAVPRTYIKNVDDINQYVRNGGDLSKLRAWQFEFLEVASGHGGEFVSMLQHFERLMLRGWLVPERSVAEGTYGTRADAQSHADIALTIADDLLSDIVDAINREIVNKILRVNYGEQAVGAVTIKPAPLTDERKEMVKNIITNVLINAGNRDILEKALDLDAMYDMIGLPKLEKTIEQGEESTENTNIGRQLEVGKVQAISEIAKAVGVGEMSRESAIGQLVVIFGFTEDEAQKIIGSEPAPTPPVQASFAISDVDLSPPEGMREAARNGITRHEAGESGDGLKPETVRRANIISSGARLTPEHVKEMAAWFARHGTNRQEPGTPWYAAWQLWGGDAGAAWSKRKSEELERAANK